MDVVFRDVASDDLYLISLTDFSDEVPDSCANSARQYGFMVFSGPDQVVLAIKDGMAASSVELHYLYSTILKRPPEGVGFAPND